LKIKLDENLPYSLAQKLQELGHDVDTVPDEGLAGYPDPDIWLAAQAEGRFLITQDLDFSDLRRFRPGSHHGLLLVRLTNPGRIALLDRVTAIFITEDVDDWSGCFIVVTERKIRVRRSAS
jgi:predicted nuclease of predicted toxin-antitoxin system